MADRSNYFTWIVYEDSLPDYYQDIIESWCLPFAMSPWHDRDVWTQKDQMENPDHVAGMIKKKHKHCLIMFPSLKSMKQALEYANQLNATYVKFANSVNGLTRYFCHLDHPSKALYNIEDIEAFNGFDVDMCLEKPVPQNRHRILQEIQGFIIDNQITEFVDFIEYCSENRYDDWFTCITDGGIYFTKTIIDSMRFKISDDKYKAGYEAGLKDGYNLAMQDLGDKSDPTKH